MDPMLCAFDREFSRLDRLSRELLARTGRDLLFKPPRDRGSYEIFSCGEYLLRSAAMVEKTFGGITTRLWDDPFEWTLPEKLGTHEDLEAYLDEVEATRKRGIAFIAFDAALVREIPSPVELRPLSAILVDCLARASHFQGRAFAVFQMLTDEKLPRL